MDEIRLEILNYSYWEHFNSHKSIALILLPDHPRRVRLNEEMNRILAEMEEIRNKK